MMEKIQEIKRELQSLKYQMQEGFGSDIEPQTAYLESIIVALDNIPANQFKPVISEPSDEEIKEVIKKQYEKYSRSRNQFTTCNDEMTAFAMNHFEVGMRKAISLFSFQAKSKVEEKVEVSDGEIMSCIRPYMDKTDKEICDKLRSLLSRASVKDGFEDWLEKEAIERQKLVDIQKDALTIQLDKVRLSVIQYILKRYRSFTPTPVTEVEPQPINVKELSEISDEEKIEIANFIEPNISKEYALEFGNRIIKSFISNNNRLFDVFETIKVYQYLQYKGYKLPKYY